MIRNRVIYASLLISSSLLAYYEPNLITSLFFHTVIYLMILSFAHLIYSYIKIKISQNLEPTIVEHGHSANYTCSIHNESIIHSSVVRVNFLFNSDMFKGQLDPETFTLTGSSKKQFDFSLSCKYRGVYSVGVDTIELTDILNIFKIKIRNIESKKITVLPKVTALPNFALTPRAESDANAFTPISAPDANSMVDVRKYQQGDALKHIHWKLSARHDELLVRNLERSAQNSGIVFLDTSKGKYSFAENIIAEDKLMEAMVSIVNNLLIKNNDIELNYYQFNPVSLSYSDRDEFHEFFTNIAKVSFGQSSNIKSFMEDYFAHRQIHSLNGKDIFIFTCHLSLLENQPVIQNLLNSHCSVHIISSSFNDRSKGAYRTSDGIHYYNLVPSSNLQDVFLGSIK